MKQNVLTILTIVILSLFVIGCSETVEELPIKPEVTPESAEEKPVEEPVIEETEPIETETKEPIIEEPLTEAVETETAEPAEKETEEEKLIKVTGENYKFMINGEENPEIKVKVGEKIKIEFTSTEGFHDFVIDELKAKTDRVNSGKSTSIEFVANQAGTFSYYCSVGNHRSAGMEGTFIVE